MGASELEASLNITAEQPGQLSCSQEATSAAIHGYNHEKASNLILFPFEDMGRKVGRKVGRQVGR